MPRAGSRTQIQKKKKKLEIDFIRVILVCCVVYFIYTFICQQFSMNEYDIKIAAIEDRIHDATSRVEEIDALKKKVNTTEFIETVARNELGLIKPYEKIFIDVNR